LPPDFAERFAEGVSQATGCSQKDVKLLGAAPVPGTEDNTDEITFESRGNIVNAVEEQASRADSKLVMGLLHSFLVDDPGDEETSAEEDEHSPPDDNAPVPETHGPGPVPTADGAPDVDMKMPYGDLEPFGREDTAQELTQSSISESDAMVDQLERAAVAEEKRAVFRALTRLRGAAITAFDGIARSQTGNIDDYARDNQWRSAHKIHHLAAEESDVSKWAFPGIPEREGN